MYFKHIYEKGLAQASYLVGCQATGEAIVIDPRRDIDVYLETAREEGLKITHITETHIHADFLSGARELAAATGAELFLSAEGGSEWSYHFENTPLKDNDVIRVGNLEFKVIHTPGHTPEHLSFLLTDTPAGDTPLMLFTGDFLFVGDVGRPDLLDKAAGYVGTREVGARQMFSSLKKLNSVPDFVQVWPGHGAGSACGKALGAVPSSTVGYEKMTNWALNIKDEEEFVTALLEGQPEPPKYFGMMKKLNKTGPRILGKISAPSKLSESEFESLYNSGVTVVDTRDKRFFAKKHISGSLNIQDNSSFSTWAGWILDYETPFLLVCSDERAEHLQKALSRIGIDHLSGYITSVDNLNMVEFESLKQITASELKSELNSGNQQILDVRGETEYSEGHIEGAMNIHVGYLTENLEQIPREKNIVVHCVSGDRSSLACSLLQKNGFRNIINLTGGMNEWKRVEASNEKQASKQAV